MFDPNKPFRNTGFWTGAGQYIGCLEQDGKHYDRFRRLLDDAGGVMPEAVDDGPVPFEEPVAEIVEDQAPVALPVKRAPPKRKPHKK